VPRWLRVSLLAAAGYEWLRRGALVRRLRAAASTDAKTGLLNAAGWEQLAQRELARAAREGGPLAILIIDIDRFKLVNDRYGHLVGDRVLRDVARRLAGGVRAYDVVGRFGGEEFVVVLPATAVGDALRVAERLRTRVNELPPLPLSDMAVVSVSIGVACFPVDGADLAGLVAAADGALYRAKTAGRDRVVLAGPAGQRQGPARRR
jgi:diguanylate cyclase (GGDEF)-like protein